MVERLRRKIKRALGKEGNFTYLSIKDQVDIFLNFLEEGAILPREFIEAYLRWARTQLQSANLSCQRLIVLDHLPGIVRYNDTGLVYDAVDASNFTHKIGSILYRGNWYQRVQNRIGQQRGKVSLAGLGLRFYPRDWATEFSSPNPIGAIDLWSELRLNALNLRLDLLEPTRDDLLVVRTLRFRNTEDFRQQIIKNPHGFPTSTSLPPLMKG